ncbi:MAG: hypothetical protein V3T23_01670 [Nitrososphaerales archaeon]
MTNLQEVTQGIVWDESREKWLLVGGYHNFKKTNKFKRCRRLDRLVPVKESK